MTRLLALVVLTLPLLSACNTIEGIGKDLKKVGESVEEAAKPDQK
jgi:predicted small secreted protein